MTSENVVDGVGLGGLRLQTGDTQFNGLITFFGVLLASLGLMGAGKDLVLNEVYFTNSTPLSIRKIAYFMIRVRDFFMFPGESSVR